MIKTMAAGLAVALRVVVSANALPSSAKPKPESKQAKISRALAAGPADVTKNAKIIDLDERGNETVLREGNGEFTCFPGHPGVVGDVPFCPNQSALQWEKDFAEYKSREVLLKSESDLSELFRTRCTYLPRFSGYQFGSVLHCLKCGLLRTGFFGLSSWATKVAGQRLFIAPACRRQDDRKGER